MNTFSPWTLFRLWCHLAPLTMVQATPRPGPSSAPDPEPNPEPESVSELHAMELSPRIIPAVPVLLAWLGSIGGVLGIISFTESYTTRLVRAIQGSQKKPPPPPDKAWFKNFEDKHAGGKLPTPNREGEAPWKVVIQVGIDGTGLQGAGGEFPQICLWNRHGELLGYNDQTIDIAELKFKESHKYNFEDAREDMPEILPGGLKSLGIWPAPGREKLKEQQATYVTVIKRHFDAICVASVFLKWPDETTWLFDGTWGQASNMSWYYSYVFGSDRKDDGPCFWLDHRGDLTHKKDLEEEYIGATIKELGREPKKEYPGYLWAANVLPETGIPTGDDLTPGMRKNGVHEYRVPLGVKFNAPAFYANSYGENYDNLTVHDFVTNPGKMEWITEPMHSNVRGGNPALPILHPRAKMSDKQPELIWEDEYEQDIPVDCMTDWYYDKDDKLVEPGSGRRCTFFHDREGGKVEKCRDNWKPKNKNPRAVIDDPGASQPPPSLQERHARTLVNDQNTRGGSSTKKLCENPHSVGPSYANHKERFFCRMTDKTLWPFCGSEVSNDCFDAEAEILVEKTRPVGKRTLYWDAIEDWHSGNRFKRAA